MEPTFSEFSYGFAVTQESASGKFGTLTAAPVIPSLYREGQAGGGWDVNIPLRGAPLFLQFKLSHYLRRSNALERAKFGGPYYRMYIRPLRYSDQHVLLTDLENSGKIVYYVAPRFHTVEELNDAYTTGNVLRESAFFRPSAIGNLPDIDSHYVVFSKSGLTWAIFSDEPKEKGPLYSGIDIAEIESSRFKEQTSEIDDAFFNRLANGLVEILDKRAKDMGILKEFHYQIQHQKERSKEKVSFAAYLTRVFFDAELLVVGESIN
jgi:hypothetical protein